ncbi:MAG: hypothetical protein C4541_04795 [Candidatus Auribacter fodinae]|jgi:hypothetical protein|uniref:PEP-CTERM sorting domain-containing protein n=1 Tax=Candidatus Auribacter fodinae TaxID=2093366 RepID=A0A3A4R535_9BACT|nr:MAG: hypothetical protein C4541_04795 [Candidatus Auribacter fodinae]
MKRNIVVGLAVGATAVMMWALSASASTIEVSGTGVTKGSVWYGYFANYPQSPYWHYVATPYMDVKHTLNPMTFRAFAEFSLQEWYAKGVDVSHITSVTLSYEQTEMQGILYNVYGMNSDIYKDGAITTDQFGDIGNSVSQQTSQSSTSGPAQVSLDVTSIVLNDIDFDNAWTGFIFTLASETGYQYVSLSNPVLYIETDLPDTTAIPEPATILLVSLSTLWATRRLRK